MLLKILFFILGAMVGSFLNVCIYRMPRAKSIISPRSHCVHCGALIKWYENIPLLSYLFLKGRCSYCKKPISPRYFIVELLAAVLFVLFYFKFGLTLDLLFFLLLACGLIVATFIDLEHRLIPDSVSLGGLALGLTASAVKTVGAPFMAPVGNGFDKSNPYIISVGPPLQDSLLGALVGGLSIYAVGLVGKVLFRKKLERLKEESAMGLGDVKFLAMLGAFLGWRKVMLVFFLAPFFGAAVGLVLKLRYKIETIPYGPYLSLAAIIVIVWGEEILRRLFYF